MEAQPRGGAAWSFPTQKRRPRDQRGSCYSVRQVLAGPLQAATLGGSGGPAFLLDTALVRDHL